MDGGQDMQVVSVPVGELKHASYNPRKITPEQFDQIKQSIESYGLVQPLVVNHAPGREGVIIGGNQRFEVLKKLGRTEVDVVYVDIPDLKKEKELNIRLNANAASWDFTLLKKEKELNIRLNANAASWDFTLLKKDFDFASLTDWGFDKKDISFMAPAPKEETDEGYGPPEELQTKQIICPKCNTRIDPVYVATREVSE